ncbi:MAG: VacJ family lipoprotein, partial [Pseudomonadota bacterium]
EAALDKYEFLRDAYLQRRRSLVFDGNPPRRKADEDLLSESKVQGPSTSNVTVVERLPENSR